jgi:hypothetical protein
MADKITKSSKIALFKLRVIDPAVSSIDWDEARHDDEDHGAFPFGMVAKESFDFHPGQFNQVNPVGGRITASDLVDLFQVYAWNLTSIRRATCLRKRSEIVGGIIQDSYDTIFTSRVTALSADWRMILTTFNSQVIAAPNPLTNLEPGNIASESSIDTFIERLRTIVSNHRTGATVVEIETCHASCHAACHGSRGRR